MENILYVQIQDYSTLNKPITSVTVMLEFSSWDDQEGAY